MDAKNHINLFTKLTVIHKANRSRNRSMPIVFKFSHTSLQFLLSASLFLNFSPLLSFEIRHQLQTEKIGYRNCNSLTNGELTLIRHFLKKDDIVFDVGANRGEWSRFALEKEPSVSQVTSAIRKMGYYCTDH